MKIRKEKFKLGQHVKDTISGYEGVITAITKWYNGCVRYRLEPDHLNSKGELIESETFDEEQLELTPKDEVEVPEEPTGGCRPNDIRPKAMR